MHGINIYLLRDEQSMLALYHGLNIGFLNDIPTIPNAYHSQKASKSIQFNVIIYIDAFDDLFIS